MGMAKSFAAGMAVRAMPGRTQYAGFGVTALDVVQSPWSTIDGHSMLFCF